MSQAISEIQFNRARKLAAAHGHGWACDLPSEHPISGCLWDAHTISALYGAVMRRDNAEPWQWGIVCPRVCEGSGGAIRHVTMTGRLEWQVDQDGTVGIVIARPGAEYTETDENGGRTLRRSVVVLSAQVRPEGQISVRTADDAAPYCPFVSMTNWSPVGGPRAERRHCDALLLALSAVVGRPAAIAALIAANVAYTRHVGDENITVCGDILRDWTRRLCGGCASSWQGGQDQPEGCGDVLERHIDEEGKEGKHVE